MMVKTFQIRFSIIFKNMGSPFPSVGVQPTPWAYLHSSAAYRTRSFMAAFSPIRVNTAISSFIIVGFLLSVIWRPEPASRAYRFSSCNQRLQKTVILAVGLADDGECVHKEVHQVLHNICSFRSMKARARPQGITWNRIIRHRS